VETFRDLPANEIITVTEGQGITARSAFAGRGRR
jgi:hypothetical protein